MSNTILLKKSGTANAVPLPVDLALGEVALNYTDGNLFYKDAGGTVNLLVSNKFVSVTGNITGGNLNAAGLSLSSNVVSALNVTGAIAGANLTTPGLISATGTITGGNIAAGSGTISTSGNITGGNLSGTNIVGTLTTAAQTNITSVGTLNGVAVAGTGLFDTIQGRTGGDLPIYGVANANIIIGPAGTGRTDFYNKPIGNINSASVIGNVVGGNINTGGQVSATGNITGNYILGNIANATGYSASKIYNGVSEVNIATANGNANISINGTSNVVVVTATGLNVTGTVSASGNVTGGNLITSAAISAASVSASGNITGGNVNTGIVSATGTITAQDILVGPGITGGTISALGNITSANTLNGAGLSLSGNVVSALVSAANITTTANISGGYILGNGALLTGVITSVANINNGTSNVTVVSSGGNVTVGVGGTSNVAVFATTGEYVTGVVSASGNITGGNLITAAAVSAASVSASGTITGGNANITSTTASTSKTTGALIVGGGVGVAADLYVGNSVVVDNGAYGNVTTTQFASVFASGAGSNPYSIMQVRSSDGVSGLGMQAYTGSGVLYGNTAITFALGTIRDKDVPSSLVTKAYIDSTGLNVTGVVSASGNVTGGNVNAAGLSLSGNVVSALNASSSIAAGSTISAVGNITGGNLITSAAVSAGSVSASGNITGGNVNTNTIVGTGTTVKSTGDLSLSATGNIVVNSYINGVTTPVQDADAANKGYVDSVAQGLDPKASVVYATAAALPAYTYNNGTSGVGATITADTDGALSIDGSTPSATERVLVKNETAGNAPYNGIYVVTDAGSISSPFVLTRSADFNAPAEIPSAFTFVEYGSTQADTGWVCTTNAPVVIGTTAITFVQFSGAGSYSANTSAGLVLNGSVFSAKTDNVTTAFDGGGNIIVKASAQLTTPNIGAATGTSVSVTGNITGGNLNAAGLSLSSNVVSALNVTGDIAGSNITTPGLISATGTITGGNIAAGSGTISTSGNVTGGNVLFGSGVVSGSGNITGGNLNAAGLSLSSNVVSALNVTGNITGGNVNGVGGVYSGGIQVLTINDTVDGGTY